uniref:uncharacterized protein LOC122597375 n=1 Tax=Erigeron canadensis TaxID=72917 RepID=UPI001CB9A0C2|nr:uncharacterized protein LOC122597375 [Erigeron canadensis]
MERMSEYKNEVNHDHEKHSWCIMEKLDQASIEEQEEETSTISNGSLSSLSSCYSSSDTIDDDASSSSSSLTSIGSSSLLDLSDLMSHLPIKRGLSKFYHGKSESFTSLARVMSIEDLPKKFNNPYNNLKKMKSNNSSKKSRGGGGLDSYKAHTLVKPTILKKSSPFLRQRSFARSTLIPGQQYN